MVQLKEEIIRRIEQSTDQMISFRDYMDLCLYHPEAGYYMRHRPKIGKQGDFFTSSSVHPVFAETIACFCLNLMNNWGLPYQFCEIGGGTGQFARHFLEAVQRQDDEAYQKFSFLMLEKSAYHQKVQENLLQDHVQRLKWLTEGDLEQGSTPFKGVILANEVADALPVYVVEKRGEDWLEIGVGYDPEQDQLVEQKRPLNNQAVKQCLTLFNIPLQEGQRLEIPLDAINWVKKVSTWLGEGLFIIIDYGYQLEDLTDPRYLMGTLRTFYRHQVDSALYEHPGEKDMTADVCFDVISRIAQGCGLEEVGLFTQASFLVRSGILDLLEDHQERDPFAPPAKKNRAIRSLISPGGISDAFRVLVLAKGIREEVRSHLYATPF